MAKGSFPSLVLATWCVNVPLPSEQAHETLHKDYDLLRTGSSLKRNIIHSQYDDFSLNVLIFIIHEILVLLLNEIVFMYT